MLSNNTDLQQVHFCRLLGLIPVDRTQINHQWNSAFYQQQVALASPQQNNLTDGPEKLSAYDQAGKEPKDKIFICSYTGCGKKFKRYKSYRVHERSIHLNEKPFRCQLCNKKFTQKSDLAKHTYTHSGIKPFLCLTCEKPFSQSSNLYTHMKRIHKIKPAKQVNWIKQQAT